MAERLFLIDGHSHLYQAYYTTQGFKSPSGRATGASFGFTNMLLRLLREESPDYVAVVFDAKGPTFRHEAYDAYKAHRKPMPEDLGEQIPDVFAILDAFGFPRFQIQGYEADDVLATLARRVAASRDDIEVLLVSADKDLKQVLTDRIKMYNSRTHKVLDAAALLAEEGLTPAQIPDYLALVGDTSDNVPGVNGIGETTARKLLAQFETLEGILAGASRISGARARAAIEAGGARALESRRLTTLVEAPVGEFDLERCRPSRADRPRLASLYRELGFRRFLEDLGERSAPASPPPPPAPPVDAPPPPARIRHRTVLDRAELDLFLEACRQAGRISFDLETTSTEPMLAKIVGISLSHEPGEAIYLPIRAPFFESTLPEADVLAALAPILADPAIEKVGQNSKYDLVVLANHGIEVGGLAFDTLIAAYLLDPAARGGRTLDELASAHLGLETTPIEALIGKAGKGQASMDQVPLAAISAYACEDADVTLRLAGVLERKIGEARLGRLLSEVEMPLVPILARMERIGIRIDPSILAGIGREIDQGLSGLAERIHETAGEPFNIDSPKQLQSVLFQKLKLPRGKKTKTGFSTDADVLADLVDLHPICPLLLEYRQLTKLKNTYVDTLPRLVHPRTGRIHSSFNQTQAATGRLSSSEPNLQNIPIRTDLGRRIRTAFIAGAGDLRLVVADYSQIELRMLAHLSQDPDLARAFAGGVDIHAHVAGQIFDRPIDEVTSDERRRAKAVNFGIIYGQTAFGLSKELGISRGEASDFIKAYFERYPVVRAWIDGVIAKARVEGEVETILGRRRALPGIESRNPGLRGQSERMAVNTVVQGSAADLIKLAMIALDRRRREGELPAELLLQIHDELVFEAPADRVEEVRDLVVREMTTAMPLSVALAVDVEIGTNWLGE